MKKRVLSMLLAVVLIISALPITALPAQAASRLEVVNTKNVTGEDIIKEARKWANSGATYWSGYEPWLPSIYWRTGYTYQGQTSFDCSGFVSRVLNDVGFRGTYSPYGNCILSEKYGNNYIAISIDDLVRYGTDISDAVAAAKKGDYSGLRPGDIIGWRDASNGLSDHIIFYAGLNSKGNPTMVEFTGSGYLDREITSKYQQAFKWGARLVSGGESNSSTSYLSQCKESVDALGTVKVIKSTTIKSLPCSKDTNAESVDYETVSSGEYEVTHLYKNTAGNYWYEVVSKENGKRGYLYAGDTEYLGMKQDLKLTGATYPTEIVKGNVFVLKGTISSVNNQIVEVGAYVTSGSTVKTGTKALTVSGRSVDIKSKLDASNEFNKLSVGTYTYVIRAKAMTYKATGATTKEAVYMEVPLYSGTFKVVAAASCSHSYSTKVTAPTCTAQGYTTKTCTKCGISSKTDYTAATGHSYGSWVTATAATCTAAGTQKKTCSSCGDVQTQSIAATGHSYTATVTTPNCVEKGYTTYTCDCGDSYKTNYVNALGHTEVIDKAVAATCTTSGKTEGKHCSVCNAILVKQETVAAKGHTEVTDKAVAATCTAAGKTAGKHCSVCNEVLVQQETIAALGHNYQEGSCTRCDAQDPNYDSTAAQLKVGTVTGTAGETITVPVSIVNNPGFAGMAYDVCYDSSVLELVSYEVGIGSTICTDSGAGTYSDKVNFQYAGLENITGDGVLVTFTFKIRETAEAGTTAITVVLEEGTVFRYDGRTEVDFDLTAANGGIEIVEYMKGDVSGDGKVNNRDAARLMQYLAGWDVDFVQAALDVNGDGKVNNRDAARLMQYLAGWDVEIN